MLLELLAALAFFSLIFAVLVWLRRPLYRIDKHHVANLFDAVLEGQASDDDWNVFIEVPIRYNPQLDSIREHCAKISEDHGRVVRGKLKLDDQGLSELREQLAQLTIID